MNTSQQKVQLEQLKQAVTKALDYAKQMGAEQAEVAISRQQGLSVATRMCEIETVEFNQDGALGISVYKQGCKGNSSTADLSDEAIKQSVKAAIEIANYTQADECNGLADAELMVAQAEDLDLFHPHQLDAAQLEKMAIAAEKAALSHGIEMSDGGNASGHTGTKVYGNTHGVLEGYSSSRYGLSCVAIAKDQQGMQRDYDYTVSRKFEDLLDPEQIGLIAAQKVKSRLNARKLKTQSLPVIFDADVATGLLGHLVSAISGTSIYRKSSFLMDAVGTQIFPQWFNISERPHLKMGLASAAFDSEGVATKDREIIEAGILSQYLLSAYSARKLGLQSTGHAGGIYNWLIANSQINKSALLKKMGTGILVTEVMGQGVNSVTGDYSRGAAGFYVENGEILYPVEEFTIAANLKDMYRNMVAISDDIDHRSTIKTGSILLENMKIAGN
ncbi:metalloprotease PmbA [Paraferrimonas sp. SM1919]|uniref:metalloprotease PmbA n=1 Tax=Paraferrimonas sp. SM1919 TaxID=2662263 RepID=UPI001969C4F3|nr:metalloprotease PmbA [Paraferrimonas sp. SM1919]